MMSEIINDLLTGELNTHIATFIVALILGLFKKQPKFIQKLFSKSKDVLPDNVENILIKLWDKVEPFAIRLYRTVLEQLAQEMLKEVNGDETNLTTGLRSTMRDVKIELENKVKKEVLNKANELIEVEVKEKLFDASSKISLELLNKAEDKLIKAEAVPSIGDLPAISHMTTNPQINSIMSNFKDIAKDKNNIYSIYANIKKVEDEKAEAEAGLNVAGRF